jgi:NAD-dependent SIR2 family protein deacetylase
MTYQTFVSGAAARQKYWARSHLGWRHIAGAAPNLGHRAVADLERRGLLAGIITQNVDGLHQAAGARQVMELHGGLDRVVCLGCGARTPRERLAQRLRMANPGLEAHATQASPDGDAWLADDEVAHFRVLDCESCDGMLKPDVVFFGENVPRPASRPSCNARSPVALGPGRHRPHAAFVAPVRAARREAGDTGGGHQPRAHPR